jgi:hypothetical protein
VATPLIKTMGLLAHAVGGVAKEWDGLDKASKKGGVEGFLAGGLKYDAKFFFQPGFALSQLFGGGGGSNQPPVHLVPPSTFFPPNLTRRRSGGDGSSGEGPFGAAQPIPVFKTFTDTMKNQLEQARAALTKGTADDVAAAKAEIALIKREIATGHLSGNSLLQALQAEASAVSTIQSAEVAAAQKRAAKAQALKAKIQQQIENSIDPIKLEVNLSKAQAQGNKSATVKALKALREAARKALASGKLNLQQQKEAYDQITQLNQEIAAATKQAAKSVLGDFKELNTAKIADKVTGLTAAQRAQLRAALSQIGPHHTVPRSGVGAEGYQIGDNGRPVNVYLDGKKISKNTTRHQQRHRRRNTHQRRGPNAGD